MRLRPCLPDPKRRSICEPQYLQNGMGVGIPNTGLVGLTIAAALGMVIRIQKKELEVLADLSPEQIAEAKALAASSA